MRKTMVTSLILVSIMLTAGCTEEIEGAIFRLSVINETKETQSFQMVLCLAKFLEPGKSPLECDSRGILRSINRTIEAGDYVTWRLVWSVGGDDPQHRQVDRLWVYDGYNERWFRWDRGEGTVRLTAGVK